MTTKCTLSRSIILWAFATAILASPLISAAAQVCEAENSPLIAYAREAVTGIPWKAAESQAAVDRLTLLLERIQASEQADPGLVDYTEIQQQAYYRLGRAHARLGQADAALQWLQKILRQRQDVDLEIDLAMQQVALGDLAAVRQTISRVGEHNLQGEQGLILQLDVAIMEADWYQAIWLAVQAMNRNVKSYPSSYDALWVELLREQVKDAPRRAIIKTSFLESERHWPAPVLRHLKGNLEQGQLLEQIRNADEDERLGWLLEALFYCGAKHWIEGRQLAADSWLQLVLALRLHSFRETHITQYWLQQAAK